MGESSSSSIVWWCMMLCRSDTDCQYSAAPVRGRSRYDCRIDCARSDSESDAISGGPWQACQSRISNWNCHLAGISQNFWRWLHDKCVNFWYETLSGFYVPKSLRSAHKQDGILKGHDVITIIFYTVNAMLCRSFQLSCCYTCTFTQFSTHLMAWQNIWVASVFRKHSNAWRGLATSAQTQTNQNPMSMARSILSHSVLRWKNVLYLVDASNIERKTTKNNNKSTPRSFGKSASLLIMAEIGFAHLMWAALPTADESNHSATGMLHLHGNATCVPYITLH